MEQRENLLDLIKIFFKWIKPISYLCIGIGIGTALLSLLLPNYYQSTTTFYAAGIDQVKPSQIFGTSTRDVGFYGDDRDNDRLMTIAESNELIDYIIQKFDLYTHYEIDPTEDKAAFRVREKFNKYYSVIKTKRDAIELSIEDTNKELAAQMVNAARQKVDELAVQIIKEKLHTIKENLEKNISEKSTKLHRLGDSILVLRNKYGIYNLETQGDVFATQILVASSKLARENAILKTLKGKNTVPKDTIVYIEANVAGYQNELDVLKKNVEAFNEGQSTVLILERQQKDMSNKLSVERVNLNQLQTAYNSNITIINLVEAGSIPIIKSSPKRSLIVISAVLITFIFSFVGLLIFESYRDINWQEIIRG